MLKRMTIVTGAERCSEERDAVPSLVNDEDEVGSRGALFSKFFHLGGARFQCDMLSLLKRAFSSQLHGRCPASFLWDRDGG